MRDNLRYKFDPRPLVNNLGGPIKSDFQMRVEGSRGEIGLLIWEPGLQVAPKTVIAVFVKSNLPSNSPLRDMEISPSSRINLVYWDIVGRRGPSLGYVKALKMARSGIDNSTVYEFALSHLLSYLCCLIKRKERGREIGSLWVVESCTHTHVLWNVEELHLYEPVGKESMIYRSD